MRKAVLYLGGCICIPALLGACVSKKKFEELAMAKRAVDRSLLEVRKEKSQLEKEFRAAKDDFNAIRYKLTENNAAKDKTIDQLYTQLRSLESKQLELKSELSDVADQIKTTTQTSGEQIAALENSLRRVTADRDDLRKRLTELQTNLEFENRKLKARLEETTSQMQGKEEEIAKLKAGRDELNKKLSWIRKTKADADAEIKKLSNQVKLLKSELSK